MGKKDKLTGGSKNAMADASEQTAAAPVAPAVKKEKKVREHKHERNLVVLGDFSAAAAKLTWLVQGNPRSPKGATFARYAAYMGADTVGEYFAKGGTKGDLLWDLRSGYLSIEGVSLSPDQALRPKRKPPMLKIEKEASKVEASVVEEAIA